MKKVIFLEVLMVYAIVKLIAWFLEMVV